MTPSLYSVASINAAQAMPLQVGQRLAQTGHFKTPVAGPVAIDAEGVPGDFIGNHKHHGGPDQAIYLYSLEDIVWWSAMLRREITPGFFGENLTLSSWWPQPRVGDRVRCGSLLLELTGPRTPCATMEARFGIAGLSRAFVKAERCGAYARVLEGGSICAGQPLEIQQADHRFPAVVEVFRYWHGKGEDRSFLSAALAAPLACRIARKFEERLAKIT